MSKPRTVPNLAGSSVAIFRESIRAEETWLQYERRFVRFLQWLGLENNADIFLEKVKRDRKWAESKIIEYVSFQKGRTWERRDFRDHCC